MSFADRLRFVLQTLGKGGADSIPVVFILEEINLIAEHNNQILLYNLFDIAQSCQNPICVIGISSQLVWEGALLMTEYHQFV